jgi:RNA polymerase sigma factor for flagellar operon FliA
MQRACNGGFPGAHGAGNLASGKGQWPIFIALVPQWPGRGHLQAAWMRDTEGQFDTDHLVVSYAPLVKRIAYQMMARLPASVEVEDLMQDGMMGLLDAIGRYEDGMGAQFETYAAQRIRGAMLDGLRESDWAPRSLRRDMRRIEAAIRELEQKFGRPPGESELADHLGMALADYQRMLQEARGHQLVYFDDFTSEDGADFLERHLGQPEANPLTLLEDADARTRLIAAIEDLPEREKMVMALYYDEDLNLREIGEVLGVTESRISQLHSQAVARLRARMAGTLPASTKKAASARRGRPSAKTAGN